MGFCLEREHGMFSTEARRESFSIHFETFEPEERNAFLKGARHPEFRWEDLDDLVRALMDLRKHAHEQGIITDR